MLPLIALAVMLTFTATAYAAQAPDALQTIAAGELPANAVYRSFEMDDGRYELKYYLPDLDAYCEIEFGADHATVARIDTELRDSRGGKTVALSEDRAREIVLAAHPGAVVTGVAVERDDGLNEYKVRYTVGGASGVANIHTETGAILEDEIWLTSEAAERDQAPVEGDITAARARAIALNKAGSGMVIRLSTDTENGRKVYEGEIITDTREIEFEIDALTGAVLEWDSEPLDDDDRYDRDDDDDDRYDRDDDDDDRYDRDDDDDDHYDRDDDDRDDDDDD